MRVPTLLAGLGHLAAAGVLHACSSHGAAPDGEAGIEPTAEDAGDAMAPTDGGDDDGDGNGVVVIATGRGTPISSTAFGQNYWDWVDWNNDGVTGLTHTQPLMQAQHLNVVRAGGINNDQNSPRLFDTTQIDAFVRYCRDIGAEPILQVPLVANNLDGGVPTADTAAAMVTYANVTNGYGIKYWEIGNEPDLYPPGFAVQSAAQYCTQFRAYAAAMRAANAAAPDGGVAMHFLGPELAVKYTGGPDDWLTPFLDACKNDVDIVSVHRYPFAGAAITPDGVLDDVTAFRRLMATVTSIVQAHARPGTPLAVTESNLSYDYAWSAYTDASAIAAPGTFDAALWTADVMGAALETNLWSLDFWNIGERSGPSSVLGFIVDQAPVPAYYAEQMISANFKGQVVVPTPGPAGFSIYASHDPAAASTAVAVLNKTTATNRLTLVVDTHAPQSFDVPALSITLLKIPDAAGSPTQALRYTSDDAQAGTAPRTIQ
jgi:hypothetical protein